MTFKQFEDVPVWQDGADLSAALFAFTEDRSFRGKGDIANQLQRAGLSVPNNIAEGFERGTTGEVITFLYYARGSAGEVRSILCVMERIAAFAHLKSPISNLKSRAASVSRQLRACAALLQDSAGRAGVPVDCHRGHPGHARAPGPPSWRRSVRRKPAPSKRRRLPGAARAHRPAGGVPRGAAPRTAQKTPGCRRVPVASRPCRCGRAAA